MQSIKWKKHPFLCTIILWIWFFVSFGCFKIDGVVTVSYLLSMVIAGTAVYVFYRRKERVRKVPTQKQKALLYMLGAVVYTGVMLYVFDHTKSSPAIHSRNELIPFLFLTAVWIGYCIYMSVRKKWSYRRIILAVILFSSILHLFFMMTAKFNLNACDMGYFFSGGHGHAGYIEYLYNHHFIPAQFDPREKWQYYHPPLNHLIQALLLKIQTLCGVEFIIAIKNIQFPTLLYVMLTTVCTYLIGRELKLKKLPVILAVAVIAFSPAYMYIGTLVNNDMLSVLFIFLCILYTLRWRKNPTANNILKIALCFGLGMFTKLSVALVAPSIAIVFIYALVRQLKTKNYRTFGRYCGQMGAFLGVAAPLSLYWSLRNLIRFGIPLGYVPTTYTQHQYIPNPVWQRLFDFNPSLFANPYTNDIEYFNGFNEYNPMIGLLKSSATDDGTIRFILHSWAGYAAFWTTFAVAAAAFVLMIYVLCAKKSMDGLYKIFFGVLYAVYIISYEYFCIAYPYTCTEHIRYGLPLILIGALMTGIGVRQLSQKKSRFSDIAVGTVSVTVLAFCLATIAVMTVYGVQNVIGMML